MSQGSFTGSLEVGRKVAETCARLGKRCSLELGSKNALIVMPDADLDLAVEAAAWGAFATSGQRCTSTSRIIVLPEVKEAFTEPLLARVATMKVGSGLDPDVELAPVINEAQKNRVLEYIGVGKQEGGTYWLVTPMLALHGIGTPEDKQTKILNVSGAASIVT